MTPDNSISLIAQGDKAAFERLYMRMQPELTRYAAGLLAGDVHAGADVADEVFTDLWRKPALYRGDAPLEAWLRRIARNKAIDWLRRRKERVGISPQDSAAAAREPDAADNPETALERAQEAHRIRAAMQSLSLEHREALWLCYFEEKSIVEISEIADCPQNTVKTRLFHARKKLRRLLEDADKGSAA